MCLGQDDKVNLRTALREGGLPGLAAAMDTAMVLKPKGHDFAVERASPAVARHMSMTGG
jgi:cyclic pyranopterin phosphate synthase